MEEKSLQRAKRRTLQGTSFIKDTPSLKSFADFGAWFVSWMLVATDIFLEFSGSFSLETSSKRTYPQYYCENNQKHKSWICDGPHEPQHQKSPKKSSSPKVGCGGILKVGQNSRSGSRVFLFFLYRKTYFRTYSLTYFENSPKTYFRATIGLLSFFGDFWSCGSRRPSQTPLQDDI